MSNEKITALEEVYKQLQTETRIVFDLWSKDLENHNVYDGKIDGLERAKEIVHNMILSELSKECKLLGLGSHKTKVADIRKGRMLESVDFVKIEG